MIKFFFFILQCQVFLFSLSPSAKLFQKKLPPQTTLSIEQNSLKRMNPFSVEQSDTTPEKKLCSDCFSNPLLPCLYRKHKKRKTISNAFKKQSADTIIRKISLRNFYYQNSFKDFLSHTKYRCLAKPLSIYKTEQLMYVETKIFDKLNFDTLSDHQKKFLLIQIALTLLKLQENGILHKNISEKNISFDSSNNRPILENWDSFEVFPTHDHKKKLDYYTLFSFQNKIKSSDIQDFISLCLETLSSPQKDPAIEKKTQTFLSLLDKKLKIYRKMILTKKYADFLEKINELHLQKKQLVNELKEEVFINSDLIDELNFLENFINDEIVKNQYSLLKADKYVFFFISDSTPLLTHLFREKNLKIDFETGITKLTDLVEELIMDNNKPCWSEIRIFVKNIKESSENNIYSFLKINNLLKSFFEKTEKLLLLEKKTTLLQKTKEVKNHFDKIEQEMEKDGKRSEFFNNFESEHFEKIDAIFRLAQAIESLKNEQLFDKRDVQKIFQNGIDCLVNIINSISFIPQSPSEIAILQDLKGELSAEYPIHFNSQKTQGSA